MCLTGGGVIKDKEEIAARIFGDGRGRCGRLLQTYNILLDMFYHDLPTADRLARKWEMLRKYYPDLPTLQDAREGRKRRLARYAAESKAAGACWHPIQLKLF